MNSKQFRVHTQFLNLNTTNRNIGREFGIQVLRQYGCFVIGAVMYKWTDRSLGKIIKPNAQVTVENSAHVLHREPQYHSTCAHRKQGLLTDPYGSTVSSRDEPEFKNDFEFSLTGTS